MTDSLKAQISDEELERQEDKLEEIKKQVSQFRHNRPTELKDAWLEEQKAKIAKYLVRTTFSLKNVYIIDF